LAEALLDIPVFDVSPGEMFFASLERYFKRPPPGCPVRTIAEYGSRLAGAVVKFENEAAKARAALGCRVEVVRNGVALPERAKVWDDPSDKVVFGTAARIHPQKRLEDLLQAFRVVRERLPASALIVAGGVESGCEDYAAELASLARNLP